jgi:hypothetical protein
MSEAKIFVLAFAGTFLLAVAYLCLKDFLYTKATGRPAAERYHERLARWSRPLTGGRYLSFSILLALLTLLLASIAGLGAEEKGWSRLSPLGRMVCAACGLCYAQKRWRKQQAQLNDHDSGTAT